jgi:hypothetical protein
MTARIRKAVGLAGAGIIAGKGGECKGARHLLSPIEHRPIASVVAGPIGGP